MKCPFHIVEVVKSILTDNEENWTGERCVVPTPVPAEHKLTAVWKLSDAPSKKCSKVWTQTHDLMLGHTYTLLYDLLLQSTEEH